MRGSYRSGQREEAMARVKAYRGQIAKQRNDLPFRTERAPGSGGFNYGQSVQINRQRKAGAEKRRSGSGGFNYGQSVQINRVKRKAGA